MFIKAKVKYVCKENLLIDKKVTAIKSRIPLLFGLRLGSLLKKPKIKKEMTIYTNSVWVERGKNNSEILEYSYINNLNNKRT